MTSRKLPQLSKYQHICGQSSMLEQILPRWQSPRTPPKTYWWHSAPATGRTKTAAANDGHLDGNTWSSISVIRRHIWVLRHVRYPGRSICAWTVATCNRGRSTLSDGLACQNLLHLGC